jgi:glutathione S-transferase
MVGWPLRAKMFHRKTVMEGNVMRALLFTTGSPFARGVRIILDELGLDYEHREEITTPSVEERAEASPTLQVPTFWDGDITLWESGLIAEYLLATYKSRPDVVPPLAGKAWRAESQWQDKLVLATIQTLGAAATTISQMKWAGVSHDENDYLGRGADRLPHLMNWLESQLTGPDNGFIPGVVSVQDIFLACHLRFIENRPIGLDASVDAYPNIKTMLQRLDARESFKQNPILWWEPGVIGYAEDGKTPIIGR